MDGSQAHTRARNMQCGRVPNEYGAVGPLPMALITHRNPRAEKAAHNRYRGSNYEPIFSRSTNAFRLSGAESADRRAPAFLLAA